MKLSWVYTDSPYDSITFSLTSKSVSRERINEPFLCHFVWRMMAQVEGHLGRQAP